MKKEEIIKLFLDNGFQVSGKILPLVSSNPEKVIEKLNKLEPRPFIVSEKHVKRILEEEKPSLEIVKEYEIKKKPIKIENHTKHFVSRYEKIKKILTERMRAERLLSINKISSKLSRFSIIGMVREKKDNKLLVEDPTGETHLLFDEETKGKLDEISLDDVIGIECKNNNGRVYVRKIVYPDVLSSRKINRLKEDLEIAVVSSPSDLKNEKYRRILDLLSRTKNLDSVFLFLDKPDEKVLSDFSEFKPTLVDKKTGPTLFKIDDIRILTLPSHFFNSEIQDPLTSMTSFLKRRHLFGTFIPEMHVGRDELVLDTVPDIIISDSGEGAYKNYKGSTIISNSDPNRVYFVNLRSREVREKKV